MTPIAIVVGVVFGFAWGVLYGRWTPAPPEPRIQVVPVRDPLLRSVLDGRLERWNVADEQTMISNLMGFATYRGDE